MSILNTYITKKEYDYNNKFNKLLNNYLNNKIFNLDESYGIYEVLNKFTIPFLKMSCKRYNIDIKNIDIDKDDILLYKDALFNLIIENNEINDILLYKNNIKIEHVKTLSKFLIYKDVYDCPLCHKNIYKSHKILLEHLFYNCNIFNI
jgi:hypothetical protein